jgi:hypothetical protein
MGTLHRRRYNRAFPGVVDVTPVRPLNGNSLPLTSHSEIVPECYCLCGAIERMCSVCAMTAVIFKQEIAEHNMRHVVLRHAERNGDGRR